MSKAVLVIDIPECCADCPCSFYERDNIKLNLICGMAGEDANNVGKPDWCPLVPMPENVQGEHKQLAEWLEEYKWLKKQKEMFDPFNFALVCARKGSYEKAIEDMTNNLIKNSRTEEIDGKICLIVTDKRIKQIAEQLKEGAGE